MTKQMKRWTMSGFGRDALVLASADIPVPGAGEVLVKVAAVSLNSRDKMVIENGMGMPLQFPVVPGSDMAGTVVTGTGRFRAGDRVMATFAPGWTDGPPPGTARAPAVNALGGMTPGVLSEYLAIPEDWLVRAPGSLDDREASTLPCAGLTAWFALCEHGALKPGANVLVHGTGGVALFGLQIASALGARVIVASGSDSKLQRALQLGAAHAINHNAADWVEAVHKVTGDHGADHILETVGGSHIARSIEAAAPGGRISVIGVQDGFELAGSIPLVLLKGLALQGIVTGHRTALENFVRFIDGHQIKPVIDAAYAFGDLPAALSHLDRGPFGKIVVTVP